MRIINADELERKMYHEAFEVDSELQMWNSGCWIRYKLFEKCLKNTPTIDAADRPQGAWIKMYRNGFGNMICMCSKCNFQAQRSNFCPNCGARMKGADDGTR